MLVDTLLNKGVCRQNSAANFSRPPLNPQPAINSYCVINIEDVSSSPAQVARKSDNNQRTLCSVENNYVDKEIEQHSAPAQQGYQNCVFIEEHEKKPTPGRSSSRLAQPATLSVKAAETTKKPQVNKARSSEPSLKNTPSRAAKIPLRSPQSSMLKELLTTKACAKVRKLIEDGKPWMKQAQDLGLKARDTEQFTHYAFNHFAIAEVLNGKPFDQVARKYELPSAMLTELEMLSFKVNADKLDAGKSLRNEMLDKGFSKETITFFENASLHNEASWREQLSEKYADELSFIKQGNDFNAASYKNGLFLNSRDELGLIVAQMFLLDRVNNGEPVINVVREMKLPFQSEATAWLLNNIDIYSSPLIA